MLHRKWGHLVASYQCLQHEFKLNELIFQHRSLTWKSSVKMKNEENEEKRRMSFKKILTASGSLFHILYEAAFIKILRGYWYWCKKLILSLLVCATPPAMECITLPGLGSGLGSIFSIPTMCSCYQNTDIFARSLSVNTFRRTEQHPEMLRGRLYPPDPSQAEMSQLGPESKQKNLSLWIVCPCSAWY